MGVYTSNCTTFVFFQQLSEDNLNQLDELYKLISPTRENEEARYVEAFILSEPKIGSWNSCKTAIKTNFSVQQIFVMDIHLHGETFL
jgi:hypothetical protein